jgi:N-acetylmuramoyl-L-alanine amidase
MNINQNQNFGTHNTSVRPGDIEYIVIHYVGATGDAKANINYYNQKTTNNASADFYVGFLGDIWQYNPYLATRYCWAVGGSKLNTGGGSLYGVAKNVNCVSIEMCVRNKGNKSNESREWYFEDATVVSTIELTKYLMKTYNIPLSRVIRHYDVTGKICPNPYVYNHTKHTWEAFKLALQINQPVHTSGWILEDNEWKFYLDSTRYVRDDWYRYDGKWAWFDGAGNAIHDTWLEYKGNWYVFGTDCYMLTSEWHSYQGKQYYLNSEGIMVKNAYVKSKEPGNSNYYYLNSDGIWEASKTTNNPNGIIVEI